MRGRAILDLKEVWRRFIREWFGHGSPPAYSHRHPQPSIAPRHQRIDSPRLDIVFNCWTSGFSNFRIHSVCFVLWDGTQRDPNWFISNYEHIYDQIEDIDIYIDAPLYLHVFKIHEVYVSCDPLDDVGSISIEWLHGIGKEASLKLNDPLRFDCDSEISVQSYCCTGTHFQGLRRASEPGLFASLTGRVWWDLGDREWPGYDKRTGKWLTLPSLEDPNVIEEESYTTLVPAIEFQKEYQSVMGHLRSRTYMTPRILEKLQNQLDSWRKRFNEMQ